MEFVTISSFVVFVLIVWFHTTAFEEYAKLFGFGKWLKIDAYIAAREQDMSILNFHSYLNQKYNNFLTRLLICPFCIGFWLTVVTCLVFGCVNIPVIYVLSMLTFHIMQLLIKYS